MESQKASDIIRTKSIIRQWQFHWITAVALIVGAVVFFALPGETVDDIRKRRKDADETARSTMSNELNDPFRKGGIPVEDKVVKTDDEWREVLTPLQFEVTRQNGTERAFTGDYAESKEAGIYKCVCCGLPLFSSESKFDSGTGWPSYDAPINLRHVAENQDRTWLLQVRIEILCARCDAHLGHLFPDGPPKTTGLRYCVNSAALKFEPEKKAPPEN
jgi:peptide-methionine (R)-S-oxide reductase